MLIFVQKPNSYADDQETDARENYNATFNSTNYAFRPEHLKVFRENARFKEDMPPHMLVMGMDAAGGGQDEFAITILHVTRSGVHSVSVYYSSLIRKMASTTPGDCGGCCCCCCWCRAAWRA